MPINFLLFNNPSGISGLLLSIPTLTLNNPSLSLPWIMPRYKLKYSEELLKTILENINDFLQNEEYNSYPFENLGTSTSLLYNNDFAGTAKLFYPEFQGDTALNFYNDVDSYNLFTLGVNNGIRTHNPNAFKYLLWLYNKSLDESGNETGEFKIGPSLSYLWNSTNSTFKEGLDWDDEVTQNYLQNLLLAYISRRKDGHFGAYHFGPNLKRLTIPRTPPEDTPYITPTGTTTIQDWRPYTPNLNWNTPQEKHEKWTGWISLTANRINDAIAITKLRLSEILRKWALKDPLHIDYRTTNQVFATNKLYDLQKSDLLNAASLYRSSDINLDLRVQQLASDQVSKIFDKQTAELAANYANSILQGTAVANANNLYLNDTANYNRRQNVNAWNNILLANQKANLSLLESLNSYNMNMYKDLGETIKVDKINNASRQRSNYIRQATAELKRVYDSYQKYLSDPTNWQLGMQDAYINGYTKSAEFKQHFPDGSLIPTNLSQLSENQKNAFLSWFNESDAASAYRDKWTKHSDQLIENRNKTLDLILGNLDAALSDINVYETNNWRFSQFRHAKLPSSLYAYTFKKGGTMDRFSNYTALFLKESENVRKHTDLLNKNSLANLDKELDRLNKELLLLLNSVFK